LTDLDEMHFSEAEQSRLDLRANDLLVCEGGSIGRTALWNNEVKGCLYQNHLHRLRVKGQKADAQFSVYWLWYAFDVAKLYFGRGNVTTIPNLSQSKLAELPMAFPPLSEQKKIAHILSTVQRAIEAQERIIQTTTELKKALMHKLFTEGFRHEPQKQTEIGPIPESWEVVKLGELFETQLGKMLSQKARTGSAPKPYLRNKNVQWREIDTTDLLLMDFDRREEAKFTLLPGDLLVCEGGQPGRAAIWRGQMQQCYYQKALHRLRPKDNKITNDFLLHWLEFAIRYQNLYKLAGASTIAHLPEVQLKALAIPLPSTDEQAAIVECLSRADIKEGHHLRKRDLFQDLFRTLLHELMTAKTRVNTLALSFEKYE
jgi:type I restriction enzyme S subunit